MAIRSQSHSEAVQRSLGYWPRQKGCSQPCQGLRGKFIELRNVLSTNLDTSRMRTGGDISTGQRQGWFPDVEADHLQRRA